MVVLGIPVAVALLAIFCQMWRIKLYHCYEGRHYSPELKPDTYHPWDEDIFNVQYPEMWRSRIEEDSDWLSCDVRALPYVIEKRAEERLIKAWERFSNWKWLDVDYRDWAHLLRRESQWGYDLMMLKLQYRAAKAETEIKSHRTPLLMALT